MPQINILVVDDEKEIAELVEIYLVSDGYKVFKAYNAEEGLKILSEEEIHLVLLDVMMPGMNGLEMCRKIRESSNIPVIMLSAKSEDLDKIVGGLYLGKAKGGESFFPLGAESDAPALPEEIIYYDEEGAVCRCLNWREAQRTMLTEETKNAILVIESINEEQAVRAQAAMIELQTLIEDYFGVKGEITHLTLDNPSLEI